MSFISNLIFFILLTVILIFVISCTNMKVKKFSQKNKNVQKKVASICNKTDASHFTIRNQVVILKKKDGTNIELKHFRSLLSDGYYFCINQNRNSLILD